MSQSRSRAVTVAFAASGCLILAVWGWLLGAGLVDDTYIFLRYADNLAGGVGLVFNAGERVEGFSSVAWTLMLAAARLLTARLDVAAVILSGLASVATATVVYAHCRRCGALVATTLGLGLLSLPAMVYWSLSGMEPAAFTLLVTASLVSAAADRLDEQISTRSAALIAGAMLMRAEGVLVGVWIAATTTLKHRRFDAHWLRHVVIPLAVASLPTLLSLVGRYAYYGSLLPNTFYTKVTPDTWQRVAHGGIYVRFVLLEHAGVALLVLALLAVARPWRCVSQPTALLFGGWIVLWCAYLVFIGGDHFALGRFFLPVLPAFLLLAGELCGAIAPRLGARRYMLLPAAITTALALSIASSLFLQGQRARDEPALAGLWAADGRWIAAHTPTDTLVATNVIGAIGYFGKRPLLDMAGLVDTHIARQGTVYPAAAPGHARYDTNYVFARAPDLVVYPRGFFGPAPFTPIQAFRAPWHMAIIDFVRDPRCMEQYEHIAVHLAGDSWLEMQKKRTFNLQADYLRAPDDVH